MLFVAKSPYSVFCGAFSAVMMNHWNETKKVKVYSGILCALFCYKRRTVGSVWLHLLFLRPSKLSLDLQSRCILVTEQISFCVMPCLARSLKQLLSPNSKYAHQWNWISEHREREWRRREPSMLWEFMVSTHRLFQVPSCCGLTQQAPRNCSLTPPAVGWGRE